MGEVVAFRLREKSSRRTCEPPTGDAQILFFLGVRYIRADEPEAMLGTRSPKHGRGPGGGKKRKTRARA
jgi:hypothetical protein